MYPVTWKSCCIIWQTLTIYMSTAHLVTKNDWARGLLMKIPSSSQKMSKCKAWPRTPIFRLEVQSVLPTTSSSCHMVTVSQSTVRNKKSKATFTCILLHRKVGLHGQPKHSVRRRVLKCRTWTVQVLTVSNNRQRENSELLWLCL